MKKLILIIIIITMSRTILTKNYNNSNNKYNNNKNSNNLPTFPLEIPNSESISITGWKILSKNIFPEVQ